MEVSQDSGVICLRQLVASSKRDVNFDAVCTPEIMAEYAEDPVKGVVRLAALLQLDPESHADPVALSETYAGPALLRLSSGHWICMVNLRQIQERVRPFSIRGTPVRRCCRFRRRSCWSGSAEPW